MGPSRPWSDRYVFSVRSRRFDVVKCHSTNVTNNAQNSNGNFYISTYDATTGKLINGNLIEIPTGGLYGLALSQDNTTLYVSVYSGSAPGVHTYDVSNPTVSNPTGAAHERGPVFAVNQPWGIAIEGKTLYVASHQDSAIYEFDATTGELTGSIKLSAAPMNITVEPAAAALGP
jgi:sugar lactone lactonase YvrE